MRSQIETSLVPSNLLAHLSSGSLSLRWMNLSSVQSRVQLTMLLLACVLVVPLLQRAVSVFSPCVLSTVSAASFAVVLAS